MRNKLAIIYAIILILIGTVFGLIVSQSNSLRAAGSLFLTQITGGDEAFVAGVEQIAGKNRLLTDAQISVAVTQGRDPFPDNYIRIINSGEIDDTWTLTIKGTNADPTSSPEADVGDAIVITTITASEAGDEKATCEKIVLDANADTDFQDAFLQAKCVKDRAIVWIRSTKFSVSTSFWERPNVNDFTVVGTGTTDFFIPDTKLISRAKDSSLSTDPNNPHVLGVLAISGSVQTTPGNLQDRYLELFEFSGSSDLRVDGSVTPQTFVIPLSTTHDVFVAQIRCFGGGNGIKFGQFLSKNTNLTNGIQINIKSDDNSLIIRPIKSTEDWKNEFSFPQPTSFRVDVQSGADQFIATLSPTLVFPLRKIGTFATDDFMEIVVQDDLSSGLAQLECLAVGFEKDAI